MRWQRERQLQTALVAEERNSRRFRSPCRTRSAPAEPFLGRVAVVVLGKPMAVLSSFINNGRLTKVEDQASRRNGRFINQKRPLLDPGCGWPLSYCHGFISGQAEPVLSRAGKATGRFIKASRSGRFIKPLAVLSKPASINSGRVIKARPVAAMAVLSPRSGHVARSPISYCPVSPVSAAKPSLF